MQLLANGAVPGHGISPVTKAPLAADDLKSDDALKFAISCTSPLKSDATRALRRQHPSLPPPPVCVFLRPWIGGGPDADEAAAGQQLGSESTAAALEQATMVCKVSVRTQPVFPLCPPAARRNAVSGLPNLTAISVVRPCA